MFSVYLAGHISGLSYTQTTSWRQQVIDNIDYRIKCYSPLRAKQYLAKESKIEHSYEDVLLSSQRGIFARDIWDCHHRDAILANLNVYSEEHKVSIGTIIEITAFWMLRKPIVIIREKGNVHDHPMINEMCPFIVETVEESISLMEKILLPVEQ